MRALWRLPQAEFGSSRHRRFGLRESRVSFTSFCKPLTSSSTFYTRVGCGSSFGRSLLVIDLPLFCRTGPSLFPTFSIDVQRSFDNHGQPLPVYPPLCYTHAEVSRARGFHQCGPPATDSAMSLIPTSRPSSQTARVKAT